MEENKMKQTVTSLPDETKKYLKEVEKEEILQRRLGRRSTVVVKEGKKYYILTNCKKNNSMRHIFGEHLCSKCDFAKGGLCPKISDMPKEETEKRGYDILEAIIESKRIEKYPFITKGVELFNATREYFVVSECRRYIPVIPEENHQADIANLEEWNSEIRFQREQQKTSVRQETRRSYFEIF